MNYFILVTLIVLFVFFSLAGSMIIRHKIHHSKLTEHNEALGFIHSIVGMIYAVVLGFTIMLVWDQFKQAENSIDSEANHIANLFRAASAFPSSAKNEIQKELMTYINMTLEKEWPQMIHNKLKTEDARSSYNRIWTFYTHYHPKTEKEKSWLDVSLSQLENFADARRLRLLSAGFGLPLFMWITLIAGAFITVGFSFLFGIKYLWSTLLMSGGLALTIALVLALIYGLNHPYSGFIKVTSDSLKLQKEHLTQLMQN